MSDEGAPAEPAHLVLYDGTCGFCHRTVQWIIEADTRGRFHFAPLQGATAAALRARHPELPTDLDSVIYVDRSDGGERVAVRSEAIVRICAGLDGWRRGLAAFGLLPRWLTDLGYRVIARNRHRVAGDTASCPLPSAPARARFLP